MSNVLVIYSLVPETTDLYYFEDVNEEQLKKFLLCQNQYINDGQEKTEEQKEALYWLNSYLEDKQKWGDEKSNPMLPAQTLVIKSGFIL